MKRPIPPRSRLIALRQFRAGFIGALAGLMSAMWPMSAGVVTYYFATGGGGGGAGTLANPYTNISSRNSLTLNAARPMTLSSPTTAADSPSYNLNIVGNDSRMLAFAAILVAGNAVNGVDVYNNTVYIDKKISNAGAAGIGVVNISGSPTNVRVRNNIIYTTNGATTLNDVSAAKGLLR